LLRGRDELGHPIQLTYKGEDTHQSMLGALVTIAVQIFTLVVAIKSLQEVALMEDPEIVSYARPMSLADRKSIGAVNFEDHGYMIAFM